MKGFKIIIAFLMVVTLAMGVFFVLEIVKNRALKSQANEMTQKLKMVKNSQKEYNKLKNEIDQLEQGIASVNKRIPQNERIPFRLIKGLTLLANQEGLRNFDFSYNNEYVTNPAKFSDSGQDLAVVPIFVVMNCEGSFKRLISFLRRVVELDRVVSVTNIEVDRDEKILPRQRIKIELITYTFLVEDKQDWITV